MVKRGVSRAILAQLLGVGLATLYNWHKRGYLPRAGDGRDIFYTEESVNTFLARESINCWPPTYANLLNGTVVFTKDEDIGKAVRGRRATFVPMPFAARFLGMSTCALAVQMRCKTNHLQGVKIGGWWYVSLESVESFKAFWQQFSSLQDMKHIIGISCEYSSRLVYRRPDLFPSVRIGAGKLLIPNSAVVTYVQQCLPRWLGDTPAVRHAWAEYWVECRRQSSEPLLTSAKAAKLAGIPPDRFTRWLEKAKILYIFNRQRLIPPEFLRIALLRQDMFFGCK